MFIYDAEIIKAIQGKNEDRIQRIEYCEGWQDHKNMGISVVCGYDYFTDRYRVFMADNFTALQGVLLAHPGPLIGFNNIGFDNKLLRANGIAIADEKCYDILSEIWKADGLTAWFEYPTHIGYSLNNILSSNFPNLQKSGHGALAPVLWQQKQYAEVVDYCLEDVRLTKKVLDKILRTGNLINPKNGNVLKIPRP